MSENHPNLHIVILAAGMGTRMRSALPKVLHKVAGKSLLGHVIDASRALSPEAIHVVVGHGKDQVIEAFSGDDMLNFVEQTKQLGTADAVKTATPNIPKNAHVLMLTADVPMIQSKTLQKVTEQLTAHSLVVLTADMDDPTGLGRILRADDHNIIGIVEEKDATAEQRQITEINSGIMAARADRLQEWLNNVKNNNAQQEYYLTDIVELAGAAGDPVTSVIVDEFHEVQGINNRVQLAQAESIYRQRRAQELMLSGVTLCDPSRVDLRGDVKIGSDTVIEPNVIIEGDTTIGSNCYIGANCVIKQSTIGDGVNLHEHSVVESAKIGNDANVGPFARIRPGSDLGNAVKIGNFVETKNAVFSEGAKANHLSYVGDANVGANTNIGAGVITCNYDGANKHHTEIGKDVFVGSDSQLVAPVHIADGATIGAGSTITTDVAAGQLAISRAKQREINGWKRPKKTK